MPLIEENVIICGIIKNCGRTLSSNMEHCVKTGGLFNKCKIVIYENNSTDNTKEVLNLLKINHPIKVISEDIPMESIKENSRIWAYTAITGSDHPCRIELISNARNKVLEEINKPDYDEYKYVIWIDLDSAGWDINGIYDSFIKKSDWDIVYANGHNSGGGFYDSYAFRDSTHLFGPEITGEYFWNHLPRLNFNKETKLIPVYSSFGGVGIYKKEIFKQIKYDCIVNSDMKKFYNNIFKDNTLHSYCDKIDKTLYNIVCSEDSKFFGGEKDVVNNIFWKNNSGYNNLVVCEHVCFNLAAINAGYKIFINPKMVYKWV